MKHCSLGFDTSNYTTSVAAVSLEDRYYISKKKLLPVALGELGLRQSDAVFLHTKQLPELINYLTSENNRSIASVGVSAMPRDIEGSYMPCFAVGVCNASAVSGCLNVPMFKFSHQSGHIAATLFGADRLDLIKNPFIAFHLSGGTTEAVLVTPDPKKIIREQIIASSSDLKAGQAIDRVGKMLGLQFPSGRYLETLAVNGTMPERPKVSIKNCDISLSGLENKCKRLLENGVPYEDIALYCLNSIIVSLDKMTEAIFNSYSSNLPLVFSGGVSSNKQLREFFSKKYNAVFAPPEFSSDNAVGIAVLSELSKGD